MCRQIFHLIFCFFFKVHQLKCGSNFKICLNHPADASYYQTQLAAWNVSQGIFLYSSQGFDIVILNIALSHVYFVVAFVLLLNLFNFCAIVFVF